MSKIISFRLSDVNTREAQASEVINIWVSKGFTIRQVLVEALLHYGKPDFSRNIDLEEINEKICLILSKIEQGGLIIENPSQKTSPGLRAEFISSVRKSLKPGLHSD